MTLDERDEARLSELLAEARAWPWFAAFGEPHAEARVAPDLGEAWDGHREGWGPKSHDYWISQTIALEREARATLDDATVDYVFDRAGKAIGDTVWAGLEAYFERKRRADPEFDSSGVQSAVAIEVFEQVKRDVAWAAIERLLDRRGFHAELMRYYRDGRRLFGWEGELPPDGAPVIF